MRCESTLAAKAGQSHETSRQLQFLELVIVFVPGLAIVAFAGPLARESVFVRAGAVAAANLAMIGMVWFGLRARGQGWGHFGLNFRCGSPGGCVKSVLQSVVVSVGAMTAFGLGGALAAQLVPIPQSADTGAYDYLRGNLSMLILSLASVYVTASFGEEVIYRGFLINRIAELIPDRTAGRWAAVVVSSLVFGLVHFHWGLPGMIQTALMGLVLGVSYVYVGRNLWVTILAHGYMDTILLLQFYFASPSSSGAPA